MVIVVLSNKINNMSVISPIQVSRTYVISRGHKKLRDFPITRRLLEQYMQDQYSNLLNKIEKIKNEFVEYWNRHVEQKTLNYKLCA